MVGIILISLIFINYEDGLNPSQRSLYNTQQIPLKSIVSPSPKTEKEEDKWFGKDKFWHWAMSFTLVGSSYHFIHCRLGKEETEATTISLSFTLSCGLAKELYDSRSPRGRFSIKDFIYDLLGIATGYLVFIR